MQEQSQKEEMRAALRGDFERMRARRTSDLPADRVVEHVPTEQAGVAEVVPVVVAEQPTSDIGASVDQGRRASWRSRLLGRT